MVVCRSSRGLRGAGAGLHRLVQGGLSRLYVTAPIVFVAAGGAIAAVLESPSAGAAVQIKVVAEAALALTLFHDAAQVSPRQIGAERGSRPGSCSRGCR